MDDQEKIGLNQALRLIVRKIGEIRVPVMEREIAETLEGIAGEIMECVKFVEKLQAKRPEPEATEEAGENVQS